MIRPGSIPPNKIHSPRKAVFFLLSVGLFVLLVRLPYAFETFWIIDEAGFAAVANKLSDGHILYMEACDNKPPFVYYFYSAVFSLCGRGNMQAVHLATLLFVFLSLWLLHQLSAELCSAKIARISCITYALYLVASPAGDVFAASTEVYMVPAILAGLYFSLVGLRIESAWCWLAAGGFWGMASWIKQPGILFCLIVPIVAALDAYPFERTSLYAGLRRCVWAFAGFCTISFFWLGLMWRNGILREFIDVVILYNIKVQIVSIPAWQSVRMAAYTAFSYFKVHFAMIALGLMGLALLIRGLAIDKIPDAKNHAAMVHRRSTIILLAWLAISILAVAPGGRFFGYYLYLIAPTIAVLVAVAVEYFCNCWPLLAPLTRRCLMVFVIIGCATPFYLFQRGYFRYVANVIRKLEHKPAMNLSELMSAPISMVSRYVEENTAIGDQIFVWGYYPQIYLLSGRDFATRYFSVALQTGFVWGTIQQASGWRYSDPNYGWMYPGLRSYSFKPSDTAHWIYPGSQELLLQDLQSNPPELFIDGNVPGEWPFGAKYPIASFPKFQEFLSNNYQFEKTILGYRVYRRLKAQLHAPAFVTASHQVPWL